VNNKKHAIAFFDFDGTITKKDTFSDFMVFLIGRWGYLTGLVLNSKILILYFLNFKSASEAKEALLRYYLKGKSAAVLCKKADLYVENRFKKIVRKSAINEINKHLHLGHDVVIVTASPYLWTLPFAKRLKVSLISTQIEVDKNGFYTGNFNGKNCNGHEKAVRIKCEYNLDEYRQIFSYGDSLGDGPMLELSDFSFYKYFKT